MMIYLYGIALYLLTIVTESVLAFLRTVVFVVSVSIPLSFIIGPFALLVVPQMTTSSTRIIEPIDNAINLLFTGFMIFSFRGVIFSLLTLLGLFSGSWYTKFRLGARSLSSREEEAIYSVFQRISETAEFPVRGFRRIYVLDGVMSDSSVIGNTLFISSGAINSRHLPAILAHELGRLRNMDGRVTAALQMLTFPKFTTFEEKEEEQADRHPVRRGCIRGTIAFLFGLIFRFCKGAGETTLKVTTPLWAGYFRQSSYLADQFALRIGMQIPLRDYLEENRFRDKPHPFLLHRVPSNEQRLDRI